MKKSKFSFAVLAVVLATASAFVGKANRPYANVFTGPGGMTSCTPETCQASGLHACSANSVWKDPSCTSLETINTRRP